MDKLHADQLRALVMRRVTAALGTLHSGAPYVSMVPFVVMEASAHFVIHVSRLAVHTQDMLAEPRVSLMISAPEQAGQAPQALARVTINGSARLLERHTPEYTAARAAYLARFPEAAPMFQLTDFSLFQIVPESVRWIAGFAQARSLTPIGFARALNAVEE